MFKSRLKEIEIKMSEIVHLWKCAEILQTQTNMSKASELTPELCRTSILKYFIKFSRKTPDSMLLDVFHCSSIWIYVAKGKSNILHL